MSYPFIKILGSRVHLLQVNEVVSLWDQWIQQRESICRQVVVTGFHGIWEAHKKPDFKAILDFADQWIPDGIAPVWVARLRGFSYAQRIPGTNLMKTFFELANRKGYGSFFYGDTEATLAQLKKNIRRQYPNHRIAGTFSPPFRPLGAQESEEIIDMINRAKPDVLWVGLGLPKQERWIFEHKSRLRVPVAAGVGAAFRFLSGTVRRAPNWVGDHGLEWLWRFIQEPKKLWKRDILDGPCFIAHVLLELAGLRNYE